MAQLHWWLDNGIVWTCLFALLQSGTTSTIPWEPRSVNVDPVSPVRYDFEDNNRICVSLSPSVTVVVTVTIVDPSLSYWVDMPPHVDINLVQTRRTCYHNASEMCLLLVITTTSTNLTEGIFNIYYKNRTTVVAHGPLGFSNPSGSSNHVLLFHNNTAMLLYRQTAHESTANLANTKTSAFRVCSNGELAHFDAPAFPLTDCRLGTGAGGYSVPYAINVLYAGSHTIHGQQFTIVSSENCTSFSTSYHFIAFDAALIAITTRPPAPITSPSPLSATTSTSFAATNSTNISTTTVVIITVFSAAVVLAMIIVAFITVGLVCRKKKRKYDVNEEERIPPEPDHCKIPTNTNRTDQGEPDYFVNGVGGTSEKQPSSVGGASETQPSSVGGNSETQPSSVGGASETQPSSVGGASETQPSSVGEVSETRTSSVGGVSKTGLSPEGGVSETGLSSVGEVSMTGPEVIASERHQGQVYDSHDTLPHTSPTSTSPPQPCLAHTPADPLKCPYTVPVVRRENSITESTTTTSTVGMNQDCQPHPCCQPHPYCQHNPCCQHSIAVNLRNLNRSVGSVLQNQTRILINQEEMKSNQEQQAIGEQDVNPEQTESGTAE